MASVQQIESEISQRGGELRTYYLHLRGLGWHLAQTNLWLGNASVDSDRKTIFIDDDDEGIDRTLRWVHEAVCRAYCENDDIRLSVIRDHAIGRFQRRGATRTDNDLIRMADVFRLAAFFRFGSRFILDVRSAMNDLTRVLAGRTPSLAGADSSYCVFRGSVAAESTGFKREYRDRSNQVRHATASIQASMRYGAGGWAYMQFREVNTDDAADRRLNDTCFWISGRFGDGVGMSPEKFEGIVLDYLGDPSQTAPWPVAPVAD